jgi:hypothetical protein
MLMPQKHYWKILIVLLKLETARFTLGSLTEDSLKTLENGSIEKLIPFQILKMKLLR